MEGELVVAVCTNRAPAESSECLAALRAQVPEGRLALVASGLSGPAVDAHRGVGLPLLAEPREGLARARNRALAWAARQGAEVVAFVDDDAVPDPGWYEALARRWREAPAEIACIGGPIRPRYPGPPPAWVSEPITPVLTLLDRGPKLRDLDLGAGEAVYGANISFRVEPLRQVGGFDPLFGHAGSRTFFAEEDEAQRSLASIGYAVRYVPDAGVTHVIAADRLTRRSFLARRFAYGGALRMRGARPWRAALRQALRSGAGALIAAGRGQEALAMERAVRCAENLGALAWPLWGARGAPHQASIRPRRIA